MDPQLLLRGLAKFVAVVLAAGLAGAGIGIGLAELSGNDATTDPVLPATTAQPTTATTTGTQTGSKTTATTATGPTKPVYRVPRVEVLSAELDSISESTGGALVAIRVRLTNRGNRALTIKTPALLSGDDEVPLGASAGDAAGPLLKAIAVGESATGVLRFSLPGAIAQRVTANPGARLRVGNRIVTVRLTPGQAAG
jgi:hypothetical protein